MSSKKRVAEGVEISGKIVMENEKNDECTAADYDEQFENHRQKMRSIKTDMPGPNWN